MVMFIFCLVSGMQLLLLLSTEDLGEEGQCLCCVLRGEEPAVGGFGCGNA